MKKKKTLIAILLSGFLLTNTGLPFVQAAPANNRPPECEPQLMIERMAEDLGLEKNNLETYLQRGVNPHELMHAAILGKASNKSLIEILAMKTLANTWGDVEQSIGVTEGQIRAIQEDMLATKLTNDLSIPKETIVDLLKSGYIIPDIEMAATLAKNTQKPITKILSLKKINNRWSDVAQTLGVDPEILRQSMVKHHGFPEPGMQSPDGRPGPTPDDLFGSPNRL